MVPCFLPFKDLSIHSSTFLVTRDKIENIVDQTHALSDQNSRGKTDKWIRKHNIYFLSSSEKFTGEKYRWEGDRKGQIGGELQY